MRLSTEVNIIGFEFKENNFYGGENLGSLESEVVGSIEVYILNDLKSILKGLVLQKI